MFEVGSEVPFQDARDAVSVPIIRRWCDAMGDDNPVHTDEVLAEQSRFGRVVAPIAMLDVWTKPGLAYVRNVADPQGNAFEQLDEMGYTSAVAVTTELTQHRSLVLGDLVTSTINLDAVSAEKTTALGSGRFVTTVQSIFVGSERVGEARFTVLKYRPISDAPRPLPEASETAPPTRIDEPPADDLVPPRDALGTVLASSLATGMALPPVAIPVTATLVIAGALMTSDYFEVHHDQEAARRRGMPDMFMNIHTSAGLLARCVGNWLGPNVEWRSLKLRLGVPNHPNDRMRVESSVTGVDHETGDVTFALTAVNGLGIHARASVELNLPTA